MKSYEQIKMGMERPCNQKEKIATNYENNNWENNCILWRSLNAYPWVYCSVCSGISHFACHVELGGIF